MSNKDLYYTQRNSKPPRRPSPSHIRRKTLDPSRNPNKTSSSRHNIHVLHRSRSEPCLWSSKINSFNISPPPECVLYRPQTCTDIFSSPDWPKSPIKKNFEKLKVVMNVTVEGSPGPVRVMLKLGWTVEETIKFVINKYREEGRSPLIHKNDVVSSTFDLHHSCFSLQCLDKSDIIGDVGGRSFYLRKSKTEPRSLLIVKPRFPLLLVFSDYISGKISEVIRRTRKLWMVLGCITCDE